MATRDEIATAVRANLEDNGVTYYSATDINNAIQDGYNRVVRLTGSIQKAVIHPNMGQPYWELATTIPDYMYVTGIWGYVINRWLQGTPERYIDGIRWDWELWHGQPNYFTPIGYRRIAVAPHLVSDSGSVLILYKALADTLYGGSTPILPLQCQDILEFYATMDLLEQAKEFTKAQKYFGIYKDHLEETKKTVKSYADQDRMLVMQPFMPLPRFGPTGSAPTIETPAGAINGVNQTFTLSYSPTFMSLYRNGQLEYPGYTYNLVGNIVAFFSAPANGNTITAYYVH